VNGLPLSVTEPLAVALPLLSSASMSSSVDLPAPDGPITAIISPPFTAADTSCSSGFSCVARAHGFGFLPSAVTGTVYPHPSRANSTAGTGSAADVPSIVLSTSPPLVVDAALWFASTTPLRRF